MVTGQLCINSNCPIAFLGLFDFIDKEFFFFLLCYLPHLHFTCVICLPRLTATNLLIVLYYLIFIQKVLFLNFFGF